MDCPMPSGPMVTYRLWTFYKCHHGWSSSLHVWTIISASPRDAWPSSKGTCCSESCKQHPHCGSFVLNMLYSAIDWPLCLAAVVCNALTCCISFPFEWIKINAMCKIGMDELLCAGLNLLKSSSTSCRDGSVVKELTVLLEGLGSVPSIHQLLLLWFQWIHCPLLATGHLHIYTYPNTQRYTNKTEWSASSTCFLGL